MRPLHSGNPPAGDISSVEKTDTRKLIRMTPAETDAMLQLNRAALLIQRGERAEALAILGELALDPASTLATETLAKATLAQLVGM